MRSSGCMSSLSRRPPNSSPIPLAFPASAKGAVEKLRISQGPIKPRAAKVQASRRPPEKPLDAARDEALAQSVEAAPADGLKKALMRLGRAALKSGD